MGETFRGLWIAAKAGDWLSGERVLAYSGILLGLELLTFLFLVAGTHGWIVPLDRPNASDFVSFYAAGNLADAGTPAATYHQPEHLAAEERATEPGIAYVFFYYPPVFMLLCAAFARLPYLLAFVAFEGATLIPCLIVLRGILREKAWAWLVPLLAFPAVFLTIGLGQNAFLTAALVGGATLLIDRRPGVAGLLLGALCYKPHFGLLVPVALIAGRRWRALAAAAAAVLALVTLSVAFFGWETWHAFLVAAAGSPLTYQSGRVDFAAFVSPFGALRLLGADPPTAYIVQGGATLAAAALVASVWWRDLCLPIRAATLAAATLLAVPLTLFYDLMLAAVAMAWLIRAGREKGFLPWEKTLLAGIFVAPLLTRSLGTALHLPLATVLAIALLATCAAHARRARPTGPVG